MPLQFTRQESTFPTEGIVVQYRAKAPDGHLGEISASAKVIAIQGTIVIDGIIEMQMVMNTLLKCIAHHKYLSKNQFAIDEKRSLTEEEVSKTVEQFQNRKTPNDL